MKTREPLLIWSSTLVTLQVLAGGAALGDVIGLKAMGLFVLAVAALQTGTSFYVRGQVTPSSTVVAATTPDGQVVAGAASDVIDGHPVTVDVQPVDTPLDLPKPRRRDRDVPPWNRGPAPAA